MAVAAEVAAWVPSRAHQGFGGMRPIKPERFRVSGGVRQARPGINKDEMRDVQRETNRELVDGIGRHISRAMANGMTHGQIDEALGGYFRHRNGAGADAR